jgi:hypothetical protein
MGFTIWMAIQEALSHAEYVGTLGWVLAISMMVGAILNDGGRRLISWSIAIIVSVALGEMTRAAYWGAHNAAHVATQGTAITLVSSAITVSGLAVGWFLAYAARCKARHVSIFPIKDPHNRRETDKPNIDDLLSGKRDEERIKARIRGRRE